MSLYFKKDSKKSAGFFFKGLGASFPIVLGYFPVAIAFGLAAKGAGFSALGAGLISLIVFAGASQFAFVGMIASGSPVLVASFICLALNARHVVYGPSLLSKAGKGLGKLLPVVSFGLTDEVFSRSLAEIDKVDKKHQGIWLVGLEFGAYFTWTAASWLGAYAGDILTAYLPAIESALSFSLPALFLTLLVLMLEKDKLIPVLISGTAAYLLIFADLGLYSIPMAAIAGPLVFFVMKRRDYGV